MIPPCRVLLVLLTAVFSAAACAAAPEKWVEEIDRLTAADLIRPPAPGGVVFVGSSSIRLWSSLARDFPGANALNRGLGGSELADAVYFADRIVLPYQPRMVVVCAGENDLWAGADPERIRADFRAFRARLHQALPAARLVFLSIKLSPARARIHPQVRAANQLVAADCAADPRCLFLDVATPLLLSDGAPRPGVFGEDGLHLSPAGYAIWAAILAPHLRE